VSIVLDNPYMTEAQILRALSREKLPTCVIPAIVHHRKWSSTYNVRLALVRHASAPLATILSYLPELAVSDLRELAAPGIVPESLRKYLQAEVQRRMRSSKKAAGKRRFRPRAVVRNPWQGVAAVLWAAGIIRPDDSNTAGRRVTRFA